MGAVSLPLGQMGTLWGPPFRNEDMIGLQGLHSCFCMGAVSLPLGQMGTLGDPLFRNEDMTRWSRDTMTLWSYDIMIL